ncbi:MAG: hypothetical protein ACR5LF_10100 [Symbiopectobacterium sp.]
MGLKGEWAPALFPGLPKTLQATLSGTAAWRSYVTVNLPYKGVEAYEISVDADLKM